MDITGKTTVFTNEYNGRVFYNTSVSNKRQDGSWDNMSMSIQLPQGTNLDNKTKIDIIKGFLTFYTKNDGTKVPKIVVMEYKVDKEHKRQTEGEAFYEQAKANFEDTTLNLTDDDLPF